MAVRRLSVSDALLRRLIFRRTQAGAVDRDAQRQRILWLLLTGSNREAGGRFVLSSDK